MRKINFRIQKIVFKITFAKNMIYSFILKISNRFKIIILFVKLKILITNIKKKFLLFLNYIIMYTVDLQ